MSATQELKNSIQTKLEQSGEYDRYACTARAFSTDAKHFPWPLPFLTKCVCPPPFFSFPVRLKEHLRQKLIESGWRDNLKEYTMGALIPFPIDHRPLQEPSTMPRSLSCTPHLASAAAAFASQSSSAARVTRP